MREKAEYEGCTDAELIDRFRAGEEQIMDFLLEKYKYLVRKKANALYLMGGDTDDLIQEGMIGLFKAIRDYNPQAGDFYPFADMCINRQMYTAIEGASRKKHGPLNSYIPLSEDPDAIRLADDYSTEGRDPEEVLIDQETVEDFLQELYASLSKMERSVLDEYLDGANYREIAGRMGKPEKSIDNALQRIKTKIKALKGKRR